MIPNHIREADTGRSVPEWIGATPDSPIPPRVKARIFQRYNGRCYKTGVKLGPGTPFAYDHVIALINGGENRETNLAPIWEAAHAEKTAHDVAIKSDTARIQLKHLGLKPKGRGFNPHLKRKMDGTVVPREARR